MTQIVIMPGGFHPFHAGHYALYQSARRAFPKADVYVAATNDTSTRPFPFQVKEKLAKLAGVEPGHFVQVKSPFRAEEITSQFDPAKDVLIFVRSEKDADKPPQAGGVKRDGSPSYLQPLQGQTRYEPFAKHAYMAYLPTVEFGPGMTSATEIRTAWPRLNEKRKTALVMSLYPKTQGNEKLAATVVGLLDAAIGANELNELRILHPVDNPGHIDVYYRPANTHSKQRRVVAKNIPYKGLELLTRAMVNKFNIKPEDLEIVPVAKGSLNEFAPGDEDGSEDPYKYPKPKSYARSADYFGQFEADHFDHEDMNDATGEFKGYWGKNQIAYFKFNNPSRTGSDDPGMGWYYEPESNSNGDTASAAPAVDRSDERKQQELGMIRAFLKSGNRPNPDSQIGRLMKKHGLAEAALGNVLAWPEVVNKVNSAMKATGWKGQRQEDNSFMFSTKGRLDDEFYIVIIDNEGNGMFTYTLGTVEEGDPHIGEQETLPMTEASVSELMNAVRDGFELNEGAPIVVAQAPIDVRNPKKAPPKQRYMGDIVPDTKPPSTEKRGVKGRAGQRPMPKYDESMAEAAKKCPPATQDIGINLENRQKAIDEYGYGPLNPDLPNTKFWMKKVDEWNLDSMEEAQQSLCGNCAAFDIRQETLDCIAQGIDSDSPEDAEGVIDAGDLGYCKFLKFKCASRRTCDAWVTGGPLQDKPVDENQGWAATYETNAQNFVGGMTASYQDRENQPVAEQDQDYIEEKWSQKYKSSINCANPKGFSQKAHCAGRKK